MNSVWTVKNALGTREFVASVRHGLDAGHLVFPVPPRMNAENRTDLLHSLLHGPRASGVVFRTSGTVGDSKLIVRSSANIASEAASVAEALELTQNSKVLITSPITHSYGFGILMACAEVGARVYVAGQDNFVSRVMYIRQLMRQTKFDVMTGVPFLYRYILRQVKDLEPPALSLAGGEFVPLELMERWESEVGGPLRQEYGLSEVGIVTIAKEHNDPESIGYTVPNCVVFIMDGELVAYRKDNPTSYFLTDSSETFISRDGIRTGDRGYYREGLLYLTGRKDSTVFIGGMGVVPEEVEDVLRNHELVDECVVKGRIRRDKSTELIAYITPRLQFNVLTELKVHARKHLDSYKVPRIVGLNEMPRTVSGKVDRSAL